MTELRVLAKFVHDLKWDAVPDDVKETTKKVLLILWVLELVPARTNRM